MQKLEVAIKMLSSTVQGWSTLADIRYSSGAYDLRLGRSDFQLLAGSDGQGEEEP